MHQDAIESCTKTANTRMRAPKNRCTTNQIVSLIKYMSGHPQLAKNQFPLTVAGLKKNDEEWARLAAQINNMNKMGTKKTVAQWKNTWRDLVRSSLMKAKEMKYKARADEDAPDSMESSDEDINEVSVWKNKIVDIMKTSDEESGEEEFQTVCKQPFESISIPANPTPEEVEEPKSPSSQPNSPEPSEFVSDSPCTSPKPSGASRVKKRCTKHQMISLIEYMSGHPQLAKKQFAPHEARLNKREWKRLATHLNKMGSVKTVAQWRNTWRTIVRQTQKKAKAMKNKGRADEDVLDSAKSSDEDDGEIKNVTVWKNKVADIMKSSDEESGEEEIQTVCKQPSESISVPASPTPEEVEEPKSPSSQLNSPEPSESESESDSPCTSPTQSDTGPFKGPLNSPESSEFEPDSPYASPSPSDIGPVKRRTQRSTMAQIQTLVDCIALNLSMGFGPQDSNIADWRRLTELLNTMGPPKQVVGWQKTWRSMESKAKTVARKKRRMNDGLPISLMKQKVIEIIAAYKDKKKSNALDESRVEFDELPCPTEGMPVLYARSLSPPSRLNSPDLDNIGDLDNSINFQDIELNPEISTLSLDGDTSLLAKESLSRDSGRMSPLRYDSDQTTDGESPGRHFDEVSNEQSNSNQVSNSKQITPSDPDGSFLPKTKRKIVTHACSRVQKAGLVDYMSKHSALATSKEDSSSPRYAEWRRLTKYLNKIGPARTIRFWKRTWEELVLSETPNSLDNSTKSNTDAREEIMLNDVPLPRRSDQMSLGRHNSSEVSPSRRKSGQMSPERHNSGQTSPVRRNSDQMSPERRNSGQMSPVQPNSGQRPIKRLVIPVRCYTSQVSSQGSEKKSPMLNSKDLLEVAEGRASPTESDAELERLAKFKGNRKRRCIMAQTVFLVEYMKENVDFAMTIQYSPAGCEKWRRLSKNLNKLGPSKSVQSWRTTWRDFKRNALLRKQNPSAYLPKWSEAILEIIEAHNNQATTTEETASMNGENGHTDSSQQSTKTSESVGNARCSKAQIAALADYMIANPVLATSEYKGPCADDPTITGWRQLSKNLNRMGVARSTTGWKQIWLNIVTCVRKSQQPIDWDEDISRKVLKAVGDETIVKNHSKLTIDSVKENGQMSSVHNFNQMSHPHNTDRESPVNFDRMSPMHSTGHVSPVDFDQMPSLYNSGQVSPVDLDQMSLVNIDQMSPMHNTGQAPLQSLENACQVSVNFGQTSRVHNNHQSPVTGQMSLGHNNCQVDSDQAGVNEISTVESDILAEPPLYSKHKRMKIIRPTRAQVKYIVNYMSTHPDLAKGEQKGPIAVGKRQLEWRRLGKHLNRMGPTKSTDAWKHTWRDLKRSARTAKNSTGFQAQIYQQILNIMSPANDGPIESSIDTVEENVTLPKPRPAENISVPFARSPSPELCLNAPDPLQCDIEHSSDISRHKNYRKHGQHNSSLSQSNVSTRKEKDSQEMLPHSQTNKISARHKAIRHSHQTSSVPRTSGESNKFSIRFKESEKDSLQMSSAQLSSGQSNNNQLFRHMEQTNDCDGRGREQRVERITQTRKQLNSLVDCVYAHPTLASEQETSNPRHYQWRIIEKYLNKMGPYCPDWKNRWKELKYDVARRWKKDGTYRGRIDSGRVKKVVELIAKYPIADRAESDIESVEDMPTQAPTTHPNSSVQHKVLEILSRNHTDDRGSINAGSTERIATLNVEKRTAGRDSIERSKLEGDKASSETATFNISSEDTNNLLKELIGELRHSNELKVQQNGILKQLVKQFSTDAPKSNHSKKKETQTEHVVPPVEQKQEVEDEDLTEENSTDMGNSERSGEHNAHTTQDDPSHKDNVHITSVTNSAKSSESPQITISSKEEATSSPKKQIRIADITRLMKPTFKPTEPINRIVKVKTITKLPVMPKVSLLRLKDGTMMVMPGTKLPASNDEYQTFVVGSVKHVEGEKVPENENEPAGFEDYDF